MPAHLLLLPPTLALLSCFRAGFNASIFVYGQTGAGKTFTITGDTSRQPDDGSLAQGCGLSLRVFQRLFDRITDLEGEGIRYTVKCRWAGPRRG